MRTVLAVLILAAACSPGERGGEPAPRAAPAVAKAEPPVAAKPATKVEAAPGTCEATVNKLVALSMIDAEASGHPWSEATRTQRHETFLDNCTKELAQGVVTREAMTCVEGAKDLAAAQGCLLAIAK